LASYLAAPAKGGKRNEFFLVLVLAAIQLKAVQATNPSFATGAIDSPPRLINTRPVSKGLYYKRV
jgi:hypothetical protein